MKVKTLEIMLTVCGFSLSLLFTSAFAQSNIIPTSNALPKFCVFSDQEGSSILAVYGKKFYKKSKPLNLFINGQIYRAHFSSAKNIGSFIWIAVNQTIGDHIGFAYGKTSPSFQYSFIGKVSCPNELISAIKKIKTHQTVQTNFLASQLPQGFSVTSNKNGITTGYYYSGDAAVDFQNDQQLYQPPGYDFTGYTPVEALAEIYYPSALDKDSYPVVIFEHGMHDTCYTPTAPGQKAASSSNWPCDPNESILPNYQGYAYLGQALAKLGFIAVSISANGINAQDEYQTESMQARAELIAWHLLLLQQLNAGESSFKNSPNFQDKLNLKNVGLMGHSRGGEGIIFANNYLKQYYPQFQINAVFSLAPTNDFRNVINNTPYAVMFGYCDGDVDSLDGVHYFDNVSPDQQQNTADKFMVLMMGANHNYFNSVWGNPAYGGFDDWLEDDFNPAVLSNDPACGIGPSSPRLSDTDQETAALHYLVPFFQTYLQGESAKKMTLFSMPLSPAISHISYQPSALQQLMINGLQADDNLNGMNVLGGQTSVSSFNSIRCSQQIAAPSGISTPEQCIPISPASQLTQYAIDATQQPHTFVSFQAEIDYSLTQMYSHGFNQWINIIPAAYADFTKYQYLQFRVSAGLQTNENPLPSNLDLSVILTDKEGNAFMVQASNFSAALYVPLGDAVNRSPVPKMVLNMVRIPLSAFQSIDLHHIAQIEIKSTALIPLSLTDLMLTA